MAINLAEEDARPALKEMFAVGEKQRSGMYLEELWYGDDEGDDE
jgi:hypothetical protein